MIATTRYQTPEAVRAAISFRKRQGMTREAALADVARLKHESVEHIEKMIKSYGPRRKKPTARKYIELVEVEPLTRQQRYAQRLMAVCRKRKGTNEQRAQRRAAKRMHISVEHLMELLMPEHAILARAADLRTKVCQHRLSQMERQKRERLEVLTVAGFGCLDGCG